MKINSGGVLLSHAVARVVSSTWPGLTSEFGMGSGVAPAPWPPETLFPGFRFSVLGFRYIVKSHDRNIDTGETGCFAVRAVLTGMRLSKSNQITTP